MSQPVEVTAIHNTTANLCGHSVHILGGTVGYDIGTPLKGAAVYWCGKGVIHNQGNTVLVSNLSETLNIEHGTTRVRDSLAKHSLCVRAEGCLNLLVAGFGRYEGTFDAQLLHGDAKEVVSATINLVRCDEVVASLADIEHSVEVSCLTARCEHSTYTAFECADLSCYRIVGGILQAGIEIALLLQVEQLCHLLRVVVLKRGTLDDG